MPKHPHNDRLQALTRQCASLAWWLDPDNPRGHKTDKDRSKAQRRLAELEEERKSIIRALRPDIVAGDHIADLKARA